VSNQNDKSKKKRPSREVLEDSAEILVIALLLAGELAIDSILIDREGTFQVILEGKLRQNEEHADKMANFLEQNGSLTLDDVVEGLRRRLNRR